MVIAEIFLTGQKFSQYIQYAFRLCIDSVYGVT